MVKESEKIFNFMDLDFQDITRKFIYNATHPKTNEELPHNVHIRQHDLTFCAHSSTAHQMEIFAQEFEPASYFCDWTYVYLIMS